MQTTVEQVGDVVVGLPGGSLDAGNAKVVFDMSQLQFVDSSGLGALLSCLRQLNAAGGGLTLCGIAKPVCSLFELVRMDRISEIFDTKTDAVGALQGKRE
jgi:anti-sigma B factor antagonist